MAGSKKLGGFVQAPAAVVNSSLTRAALTRAISLPAASGVARQ
jgi:hypothetical protein